MGQALLFGLIGSSALVIGGAIGAYWRAPQQVSGVLLAFASGTLISALAFELFPEAVHLGGLWPAGLGLIAGGLTFVFDNSALDSWVARSAGDPHEVPVPSRDAAEDLSGAEAEQTERGEEAATGGARAPGRVGPGPRGRRGAGGVPLAAAEAEQGEGVEGAAAGGASGAVGFALLAAVTLDGVP